MHSLVALVSLRGRSPSYTHTEHAEPPPVDAVAALAVFVPRLLLAVRVEASTVLISHVMMVSRCPYQELGRTAPRLRSVAAAKAANPLPPGGVPPLPLLLNPVMPPSHVAMPGALLVADVSGFTQLTERLLSTKGPIGVELLTRCLNSYFDKVLIGVCVCVCV